MTLVLLQLTLTLSWCSVHWPSSRFAVQNITLDIETFCKELLMQNYDPSTSRQLLADSPQSPESNLDLSSKFVSTGTTAYFLMYSNAIISAFAKLQIVEICHNVSHPYHESIIIHFVSKFRQYNCLVFVKLFKYHE